MAKKESRASPVVGVVGLGYMGLASGLAFAAKGLRVIGYDIKSNLRKQIMAGKSPYFENGLAAAIRAQSRNGHFRVASNLDEVVEQADVLFVCLPTPSRRSGSIDLSLLRQGIRQLGHALRPIVGYRLVVLKSTVIPGTSLDVVEPILRKVSRKERDTLGLATSPEFLAEGTMLHDAEFPDRIVFGTEDAPSRNLLRRVYRSFEAPRFEMSQPAAELVKYAANSFLALKITFANEMSRFAEELGADIDKVMDAVGSDTRIGPGFLRAGPGFGGSCLEKDLRALVAKGHDLDVSTRLLEAVLIENRDQSRHAVHLIRKAVGHLEGKEIAFLGVSFKAGTDDVRNSTAFPIIRSLISEGARVRVHDPAALANFRSSWGHTSRDSGTRIFLCNSVRAALCGADLAVLHTDWPQYLRWRRSWTSGMSRRILLDLRRAITSSVAKELGLELLSLGRGPAVSGRRTGAPLTAVRR